MINCIVISIWRADAVNIHRIGIFFNCFHAAEVHIICGKKLFTFIIGKITRKFPVLFDLKCRTPEGF